MPIKGIILIIIMAIIFAVLGHDVIYSWLTSEFSDNYIDDEDFFEEEQEE